MKRRLKSALFLVLYYTALEWLLARLLTVNAVAVLMYHGVCDSAEIPPEINFHLPVKIFEQQMRALKGRYRIIPLVEVVERLERGETLEKSVVITFDDGYRNNATQAAPVLSSLGLPYTVFLATKYVGSKEWLPLNRLYWAWSEGKLDYAQMRELRKQIRSHPAAEVPAILRDVSQNSDSERAKESFAMLDWSEIREMARSGAQFGSHTHSHCNMAVEAKESQEQELEFSQQLIEKNLPGQPVLFAYPYGHLREMSDRARATIIGSGFRAAISAEYGVVTTCSDRFWIPRLGCDDAIWNFTGEILYQFAKQSVKDAWLALSRRRTRPDVTAGTT